MSEQGSLHLRTVAGDGLRFEAVFSTGTLVMDSGPSPVAPNPVQTLLASLAACEAMDVISLLRKKRQRVTAYEVGMAGERVADHPRRFTTIEFVHRVTGHGVELAAVEDALRLAVEKYCSVYHCIRPDIGITNRIEIREG
jgi:putative redox protein